MRGRRAIRRYDIAASESTSVRVVVWGFVSALERVDYLRRRVRQDFEVLRDLLGDETQVPGPKAKAIAVKIATRGIAGRAALPILCCSGRQ